MARDRDRGGTKKMKKDAVRKWWGLVMGKTERAVREPGTIPRPESR